MHNMVAIGSRLAIICVVAALVLGLVNAVTAPVIEENREKDLQEAQAQVVGDASVGERVDVPEEDHDVVVAYYPVGSDSPPADRYVVELLGAGYGGDMQILAGIRADGEIFAAVLMENSETPGLGKQAEEPEYMESKFVGTGGDDEPVPTTTGDLPEEEAEAVSGATVTFMGIGEALQAGSRFVEEEL